MTDSMQKTIDETNRRRDIQMKYNLDHGLVPTQINKSLESILGQTKVADKKIAESKAYVEAEQRNIADDPLLKYMSKDELKKMISLTKKEMEKAAKELDFVEAARLRDEMYELEKRMNN
jgi:excinuclease ABC subunit B